MANRIVSGNLGGSYRLRVSKIGFNVLTTGLENCLFDSEYGFLRILARGEINWNTLGSTTFNLNLGPYTFNGVRPTVIYYEKMNASDGCWRSFCNMYGNLNGTSYFNGVVTIHHGVPYGGDELLSYLIVTK